MITKEAIEAATKELLAHGEFGTSDGASRRNAAVAAEAALTAAEERGRREERERFREAIIPAYMGLLVLKTMCRKAKLIGGVAATESALSSLVSVMPELPAISALRTPAITKEPTP